MDKLDFLIHLHNKRDFKTLGKLFLRDLLLVLALVGLCIFISSKAKADIYIKIGSGYKLIETDHIVRATGEKVYFNTGGKLSARIEIGKESGNWTYGLSHHSQWLSGFPVNEDGNEYQKTEIFLDYKWRL